MAGLPKKYAKMGFRKGWREYKKTSAYKRKAGKKTTRRRAAPRKTTTRRRTSAPRRTGGRSMARRKEKISALTVLGLIASGKTLWDGYQNAKAANKPMGDWLILNMTGIATERWKSMSPGAKTFNPEVLLAVYGPPVAGKLGSDYIGGPKGLNINSKLRAIPLFKL